MRTTFKEFVVGSPGGLQSIWWDFPNPSQNPEFLLGITMTVERGWYEACDRVSAYYVRKGDQGQAFFDEYLVNNAVIWVAKRPWPLFSPFQINGNWLNGIAGDIDRMTLTFGKPGESLV